MRLGILWWLGIFILIITLINLMIQQVSYLAYWTSCIGMIAYGALFAFDALTDKQEPRKKKYNNRQETFYVNR